MNVLKKTITDSSFNRSKGAKTNTEYLIKELQHGNDKNITVSEARKLIVEGGFVMYNEQTAIRRDRRKTDCCRVFNEGNHSFTFRCKYTP